MTFFSKKKNQHANGITLGGALLSAATKQDKETKAPTSRSAQNKKDWVDLNSLSRKEEKGPLTEKKVDLLKDVLCTQKAWKRFAPGEFQVLTSAWTKKAGEKM